MAINESVRLTNKKLDDLAVNAIDPSIKRRAHRRMAKRFISRVRAATPVRDASAPDPVVRYKSKSRKSKRINQSLAGLSISQKRKRQSRLLRKSKQRTSQVYARYYRGNLRRSWSFDFFKNDNVFIGTGRNRSQNPRARFRGNTTDGWYLHMVERGTINYRGRRFVARTFNQTKNEMIEIGMNLYAREVQRAIYKTDGIGIRGAALNV